MGSVLGSTKILVATDSRFVDIRYFMVELDDALEAVAGWSIDDDQ